MNYFISPHFKVHSSFAVVLQVGNIGGREFAESLAPDVQKLLVREYLYAAMALVKQS